MKILMTGFEPFGNSSMNPSAEVIRNFPANLFDKHQLRLEILPVVSKNAGETIVSLIEETKPQIVIMLGEASQTPAISVEKVAINWLDFRIADNSGEQIQDQPIIKTGRNAYFSTLPVRAIVDKMNLTGIPAKISYSAGTYICNQVFYLAMHTSLKQAVFPKCGFIHLPSLPEQVVEKKQLTPSMSLETSIKAVITALQTTIELYEFTR